MKFADLFYQLHDDFTEWCNYLAHRFRLHQKSDASSHLSDITITIHKDTIRKVKQVERLPKPRLPSTSHWLMVA